MATSDLTLECQKVKCLFLFMVYLWWCKQNKPMQYLFLSSYLQSTFPGPIGPYLDLIVHFVYNTSTNTSSKALTNTIDKKEVPLDTLKKRAEELYNWSQQFNKQR